MQVLMVINTSGLDYDDRLRKEALSLQRLGIDIRIVALEYANEADSSLAYDQIPARTIRLRSRRWFPRGKGLLIKTLEMYIQFGLDILRVKPDVVWCHSLGLGGLVFALALSRKVAFPKRLIWDQHELPADRFLYSRIFPQVFALLVNGCDCIVMANAQRKALIKELLGDGNLTVPIEVLDNYPDELFVDIPRKELPSNVQEWLSGNSYILAQGGANPDRYLGELIDAILSLNRLKLIVVGPYQQEQMDRLCARFGDGLMEQVHFTGFVPQLQLTSYIDHAEASIVLYNMVSQNSRLCAPNRLYQAVARGVPVVVGINPPMAEFVERWQCGVVLTGDGSDIEDIRSGIENLLVDREALRRNALECRSDVMWKSQMQTIARIVS